MNTQSDDGRSENSSEVDAVDITRRRLLQTATLLAGTFTAAAALPRATMPNGLDDFSDSKNVRGFVSFDEATNIASSVSADGQTVAIDALGVLWTYPITGGNATRLLDEQHADTTRPHWSPTGDQIAFQVYRDQFFHVCVANRDGSGFRQLTATGADHREPRFSPDGTKIAYCSDREGRFEIYVLELATGQHTKWSTIAGEISEPSWSPDGRELAVVVDDKRIFALDAAGSARVIATSTEGSIAAPAWSPNGQEIAYVQVVEGDSRLMISGRVVSASEDVFVAPPVWLSADELLYTADGKVRRRRVSDSLVRDVPFTAKVAFERKRYARRRRDFRSQKVRVSKGIVGPAISPDGESIVFCALNALWMMKKGHAPQRLIADGAFVTDPAWSRDGRKIAYTSDRAGLPSLWIRDLASGVDNQLTFGPSVAYAAAWSPDGSKIAFQDQTNATFTISSAGGNAEQVISSVFWPGGPTWSPDGNLIAVAAQLPGSKRFRHASNQVLVVDLRTRATTFVEPLPGRSLSSRGYSGPVWSPDGETWAFVADGTLWTVPISPMGRPTGAARELNKEAADTPTWSGDSQRLLYLSNGRLRAAEVDGKARTVPLVLSWRLANPSNRMTIHAGAMWDGLSDRLRHDIDIEIDGNRIVNVRPHRSGAARGETVDASAYTVMPGLIESHAHPGVVARFYGSRWGRIWLSHGVTTLRSTGDPAYRVAEERDAVDAGLRLGPRFFASGELLEGYRCVQGVNRAVTSKKQVELEIERAVALDYDLVKTYERLPSDLQREIIRAAHKVGLPVSAHWLYPGVGVGQDEIEHVFARKGSSVQSRTYKDHVALVIASRTWVTATLFATTLLADDDALARDPRIQALYPRWLQRELVATVQRLKAMDQKDAQRQLANRVRTVASIHRGGGLIRNGSDVPAERFPGINYHLSLQAMVKYGMTPLEALLSATRNPAESFGVSADIGTIEVGKLADLIVIDGDPLRDITATAKVQQVIANGVRHSMDSLLRPWSGHANHESNSTFWLGQKPRPDGAQLVAYGHDANAWCEH